MPSGRKQPEDLGRRVSNQVYGIRLHCIERSRAGCHTEDGRHSFLMRCLPPWPPAATERDHRYPGRASQPAHTNRRLAKID